MNIYVTNLENAINNEELKQLFASYGEVKSAEIAIDAFTGRSRGFGYVEMADETAGLKAIKELNQTVLRTLTITVEEAPAKKSPQGSYKVGSGTVTAFRFKKT